MTPCWLFGWFSPQANGRIELLVPWLGPSIFRGNSIIILREETKRIDKKLCTETGKKSKTPKINNGSSRMICYQLRGRIDVDPECVTTTATPTTVLTDLRSCCIVPLWVGEETEKRKKENQKKKKK